MPSPVDPLLLYDFAPFLSVAMAINFVSSFWDGVKLQAINNLDSHTETFITELSAVYTSGNCTQSKSVAEITKQAEKYKKNLARLSFFATALGIIVVVVLFVLLACIGFFPKAELTIFQAFGMCVLSIIPSSFFRICGTFYSKSSVNKLEDTSQIMKAAAKDAIRDNQQAAYKKS